MDLELRFGAPEAGAAQSATVAWFALPNAVLDGPAAERWDSGLTPGGDCPEALWERSGLRWGMASVAVSDGDFEGAAARAYGQVLSASRGLHLHRIWNFVPRINGRAGALENYRAFCIGRGVALDEVFGDGLERRLPAATGVGTDGDRLAVLFVAGEGPPRHLENPVQVPAYRYPSRYGPRPPSFARGTLVADGPAARLYVSGTGAIRDSESLHPGDVVRQCRVVLENVDLVAQSAGLPGLNRHSPGRRFFRVYLRHPGDWERVRPQLATALLRDGDTVQAVQADICRAELLMEIEARVDLPGPSQEASQ
jgi:hypothetical protein